MTTDITPRLVGVGTFKVTPRMRLYINQITYLTENQSAMQIQLDLIFTVMGNIKELLP